LEKFLLVPKAIHRLIENKTNGLIAPPTLKAVEQELETIAKKFKQEVIDSIATAIHAADKKITVATASQRARTVVTKRWRTQAGRFGIIPGKKTLACVSNWTQKCFNVSVGAVAIAHTLSRDEIDGELKKVIEAIETGLPFNPATK
jgi:hypothetical protein